MFGFFYISQSLSLSCLSPAEVCRSCCNSGTLSQSVLDRHSGYLRQRYGGTLRRFLLWPWLSVLRQEMCTLLMNQAKLRSLSTYIYLCVCGQVSMQTCSLYCQPSPDTPPSNTFIWARTSTLKTGAASAQCVWIQGCVHCIGQLEYTHLWFYFRLHNRLLKARWEQEMTRASSSCLVSVFVSAGFWMKSCRSWFSSYRRRNVWVRTQRMSALI